MKVKDKTQTLWMQTAALLLMAVFSLIMYSRAEAIQPQVAAGDVHTVGLKYDGTVVAAGSSSYGQLNVSSWTDIIQVATGYFHTVGLKSNGTVVAVGDNGYGQLNVSSWTDIIGVAVGYGYTVGLKSNGTVVAVGYDDAHPGVGSWTDIIQVATGYFHTVGLKSNGTVVAVGDNGYGQLNVSSWTGITQVAAGGFHTLGLMSDGALMDTGSDVYGQRNVSSWTEIIQVAAGYNHTVGLKSNGTVVAVGGYGTGELDVSSWTGIMGVTAGTNHTVGLKSNGTVLAVGYNGLGQCSTSGWDLNEAFEGTIGTQLTITGAGFGDKKGKVLIGSVATKVTSWTDTLITGTVKKVPLPVGPYDVSITTKTKETFTLEDAFTVRTPLISSYSLSNTHPGAEVTVDGFFFGGKKGKVYLVSETGSIKPKSCKVTYWYMDPTDGMNSQIKFMIPKVEPGSYWLYISNKAGSSPIDVPFRVD